MLLFSSIITNIFFLIYPLTRTDENLTPREMEQKAAELAYFLGVPIEGFWKSLLCSDSTNTH